MISKEEELSMMKSIDSTYIRRQAERRNREKTREWDLYFLKMTKLVASKSKDTSTKCGSVIVSPEHKVLSTGYNGLCRGCKYTSDRMERPEKYFWFEHAERNAIYNADVSLNGSTMYCSFLPCMDCARAIVQKCIIKVNCPPLVYDSVVNKEKWLPHHKRTIALFRECGVLLRYINES